MGIISWNSNSCSVPLKEKYKRGVKNQQNKNLLFFFTLKKKVAVILWFAWLTNQVTESYKIVLGGLKEFSRFRLIRIFFKLRISKRLLVLGLPHLFGSDFKLRSHLRMGYVVGMLSQSSLTHGCLA